MAVVIGAVGGPRSAATLTRMSTPIVSPRPPDAREAADAFGLGRVLGEPAVAARGEMGRIWRLETASGPWALKEVFRPLPDAADLARADVEVDVVQHLALAEPGAQLVDLNEGRRGVHRLTK